MSKSVRAALIGAALLTLGACATQTPRVTAACNTGRFELRADFAAGALGQCEVQAPDRVQLRITPEDEPINPSPWYSFRVRGSGELTVSLDYGTHRHRYVPKLSLDGVTWRPVDPGKINVAADRRSATFTVTVEDTTLHVSAQEVIDSGWYDEWLDRLAALHPRFARIGVGSSREGRSFDGLETLPGASDVVLLVGRHHPPELTGAIAMQAFVERLLEQNPDTCDATNPLCTFVQRTNIVIVPLMNPDGVDLGYWRHNTGGVDLNRDWGPFSQPETQAIEQLINRLAAGSTIRAFMDFHSTFRNVFYTQLDEARTSPPAFAENWLARAGQVAGTYELEHARRYTTSLTTSKNYMNSRFGIPAITYEVGDETPRDEIVRSAAALAEAMVLTLLPYGPPLDTLIAGATVVDGTGAPPRPANVGIRGDRIVYVGPDTPAAGHVVDAAGLILSPGFIDPHTHTRTDLLGDRPALEGYLRQGVTTVFIGNDGDGQEFDDLAGELRKRTLGPNVALWVGHNHLRAKYVGLANRAATPAELAEMAEAVRKSVAAGAVGLSTGLFYAPGSFADTDEVIALARAAAAEGGVYDTHMRDEGSYGQGLTASIDETIRIGEEAGIPVHIAHIKALGPDVHGAAGPIIAAINRARQRGIDVSADQYPWLASGTRLSNALVPRRLADGGRLAMEARLRDPDVIREIVPEMERNLARRGGAAALLITGASRHQGKRLSEVAGTLGTSAVQAAIQVVLDGDPAVASFMMSQADVDALMAEPWVVTGSDGSNGHPRKFGTFPKKYRTYVKERGLLSLPEFVRRSSGQTAELFGLCRRGRIETGYIADLALWDPETFVSNATYENPTALASGVRDLWINGWHTIADSELEEMGGYVLRRDSCNTATAD